MVSVKQVGDFPYAKSELARFDVDRRKQVSVPLGYLDELRDGAIAGWSADYELAKTKAALRRAQRKAAELHYPEPGAAVGGYPWEQPEEEWQYFTNHAD